MSLSKHILRAKGFIFDLDGTLIDTTPLVEQFWRQFALENDLDAEKVFFFPFRSFFFFFWEGEGRGMWEAIVGKEWGGGRELS